MATLKVLLVGGLFNAVQVQISTKQFSTSDQLTMMAVKNQNKPVIIGDVFEQCTNVEVEYHHYRYHCHGPDSLIYFYDATTEYGRR